MSARFTRKENEVHAFDKKKITSSLTQSVYPTLILMTSSPAEVVRQIITWESKNIQNRNLVEHNKSLYSVQCYCKLVNAPSSMPSRSVFLVDSWTRKRRGMYLWVRGYQEQSNSIRHTGTERKGSQGNNAPISEIPEDFAHLVGEESEAIAAAVAALLPPRPRRPREVKATLVAVSAKRVRAAEVAPAVKAQKESSSRILMH